VSLAKPLFHSQVDIRIISIADPGAYQTIIINNKQ